MNDGFRLVIDQRDRFYFFTIHDRGEMHESSKGYSSLLEAVEQADLYRRLAKLGRWRDKERSRGTAP